MDFEQRGDKIRIYTLATQPFSELGMTFNDWSVVRCEVYQIFFL